MENIEQYLKYYNLEDYLFSEVHNNFHNGLTAEEFFAIVIWKSNRVKTHILNGINESRFDIEDITKNFKNQSDEEKIKSLVEIDGVGMPMASAILTVCYPDDFTIVDTRAVPSLLKYLENKNKINKQEIKDGIKKYFDFNPLNKSSSKKVDGTPKYIKAYIKYNAICIKEAKKINVSLRNFDRILWAIDFYEGENGLKKLASLYWNSPRR